MNRTVKRTTKGLKPNKRTQGKIANQWQSTPKQKLFMSYYIDPNSKTFGNAYKSAIQAGYNESYAVQIASPAVSNKWIQDYTSKSNLSIEHLKEVVTDIIRGNIDSKDYTATQLKAIELYAKLDGLLIERKQVQSVIKVELGQANKVIDTQ
jgi:biotin-(acetyl-CoA carboxylase) ligase